jgi:hypothetical protein
MGGGGPADPKPVRPLSAFCCLTSAHPLPACRTDYSATSGEEDAEILVPDPEISSPALLAAVASQDRAHARLSRRWQRALRAAYRERDEAYRNQAVVEGLLLQATQATETGTTELQAGAARLAAQEQQLADSRRVLEAARCKQRDYKERLVALERELAASRRKVEVQGTTIEAQERSLKELEHGGKNQEDWEARLMDSERRLEAQVRANRALLEAAGTGGPPTPVGLQQPGRGGGRGDERRSGRDSGRRPQPRQRSRSPGRGSHRS